MEVKALYLSEKKQWQEALDTSILIWPFFEAHSAARQAIEASAACGQGYQIEVNGRPVLFVQAVNSGETCVIKNILAATLTSQERIIGWVEQFARKMLKKRLVLDFSQAAFSVQREIFIAQGFEEKAGDFEKELTYKFGLVFGGGGSHGAYQVGVWQALDEAGIPIEVIAGTSVGALNGALMAQGDLADAKSLWEALSTEKVLSFPAAAAKPEDLPSLMGQIASLTGHAIVNRGVSAEPLRQMLAARISFDKMERSSVALFFAATRIRGMKETVVRFTPEFQGDWLSWLMASASFFPAMQPQKIKGDYYIDGGYRNNIPLDVALKQGVTDCFVVDIKGPGIVKPIRVPDAVNVMALHSQWPLGSFLLFSPKRSQENLALGYLETLKVLGKLKGNWYSFEVEEDVESDWGFFYQEFTEKIGEKNLPLSRSFLKKLRRLYNGKVVWEHCGLAFIELAGRYVGVEPTRRYTYTELKEKIRRTLLAGHVPEKTDLSVSEWLDKYYQESAPLSDLQLLKKVYERLLSLEGESFVEELGTMYKGEPVQTILGAFLLYIERGTL